MTSPNEFTGINPADAIAHEVQPMEGVQQAARVDQSDFHIALAVLDPELQRLLDHAGWLANKANREPTYENKVAHIEADQAVRDYVGPFDRSHIS